MKVEIKFVPYIPYEEGNVEGRIVHLGQAHSKEECLKLIGESKPEQKGVYEYVVHTYKTIIHASSTDQLAVDKTLSKIFDK